MSQNNIIVLLSTVFVFHIYLLCINANSDEKNINVDYDNQIKLQISENINQTHDYGCADEFTLTINKHWSKSPLPKVITNYIVPIIFTALMLFGCCGNFLIIFIYNQ